MGRGKIEIKRIENLSNRQVTYSKRRNGLIKKAKEIAVLCDAKVSLIIFATSGKMHDYSSAPMFEILEAYHKQSGKKLWDAKHENLYNEIDRIKKENDSMQIKLRHLKGEDVTSLNHKELMALEDALENGLTGIRDKQSEMMERMRKNGKMLEEEHNYLKYVLRQQEIAKQQQQQQMALENNVREIDPNGYHQRENDGYSSHMPLAFRVQPIQPNLQERI
ncbi:Floral homeotic protein PISTILLATA [Citrus sinensis]|uniref:floral homeotic protein GLOBOSA isoform X1 n=1 Tax=Citrus sinensis TaxID=2711 RepID=UPI0021A1F382|nr:floral homeotic protein GLOBOSA isoform X1 [Citrus sinensis]KAH9691372.1 Floral homeotic protein PISTILLATA [Citrus sinensis]